MPNIAQVFKSEIVRLAKREVNARTLSLRKEVRVSRGAIVMLRRELALVQRQVAQLARRQPAPEALKPQAEVSARTWISGKGVRTMRRKLRVTQQEFAKLAGVSPIAVFKWEKQDGKLQLRHKSLANVMAMRDLGVHAARARLRNEA